MSTSVIYPPIVDSYMPAFRKSLGTCRIYFSLSKFNGISEIGTVQATILEQKTSTSVVRQEDDTADPTKTEIRYRKTGIILDIVPKSVEGKTNLFAIELADADLKNGWQIGGVYKVQLRFTGKNGDAIVSYANRTDKTQGQSAWLNSDASAYFSEWSTVCIIKAIEDISIEIPMFDMTKDTNGDNDNRVENDIPEKQFSLLEISGRFIHEIKNSDGTTPQGIITEPIYKYRFTLYNEADEIIDPGEDVYANQYQNNDSFNYTIKTELKKETIYKVAFKYETINGYVDGFYQFDNEKDDRYIFKEVNFNTDPAPCRVITIDTPLTEDDDPKMFDNILLYKPYWHDVSVAGTSPELVNYDKYRQNLIINGIFDENGEYITTWEKGSFDKYIRVFKNESTVTINGEEVPFTIEPKAIIIGVEEVYREIIKVDPIYADTDFEANIEYVEAVDIEYYSTIYDEEEEGRVALKFYDPSNKIYNGNICVRRADSRDNFTIWKDIYLYTAKYESINSIPVFYDYTIESGVWYKYAVQSIDRNGIRGEIEINKTPIMRNFNYSFLLGKNNQQLKLRFDNRMESYRHQIYDSKTDPIGSKYPIVTRNANTNYRTFPINGLISFNMDENKLFTTREEVYGEKDVAELYNNYNKNNFITQYDYIYEREFRQKVLDFLQNGELKLFKSPTEGNIIVRLTEINCSPNQSLSRLVYSFSATAYEMDEPTMDNYLKYGFYYVKPYESSFENHYTRLGQLSMDFNVNSVQSTPDEIFSMIVKKYGNIEYNKAGYSIDIKKVHHIKITFDDKPLAVFPNGQASYKTVNNERVVDLDQLKVGNNFNLNGSIFTVLAPIGIYEFDDRLSYIPGIDRLYLLNDFESKVTSLHATIDFLYDVVIDIYTPKEVKNKTAIRGVGQYFKTCSPDENILQEVYYKYYREIEKNFSYLSSFSSIEIEANPGAVFEITDLDDDQHSRSQEHMVGATGQLRLYEIDNIVGVKYKGFRNSETGAIMPYDCDVLMNYIYIVVKGVYA